jgi:hypothetical protein
MPEVRLRPKGQVTIPSNIIEAARLPADAVFEVALVNGVITFTPRVSEKSRRSDILSYAGVFSGAWGKTAAEVDITLSNLRDEWER